MPHWLFHWTGGDGGTVYNYMSGIVPDLVIAAGGIGIFRKHKCVTQHCYRFSRHVTEAGHAVCRMHHPDYSSQAPTAEEVHEAHHKARRLKAVQ